MTRADTWAPGPPRPPWPADEMHLWCADLGQVDAGTADLSADECAYAARALAPAVRQRRLRTRRVLRDLLGRYLGLAPVAVPITIGPAGKPQLPACDDGLCFNLSHSGSAALFVFSAGRAVGVDVQRADELQDPGAVARTSFSMPEQAELQALPASQQHAAVLRGWVRKEAYAKARGQGYGYGFKAFSVQLSTPPQAGLLRHDEHDPGAQHRWWLADVSLPSPLAAACCVQAGPLPRRLWRWPPTPQGSPA